MIGLRVEAGPSPTGRRWRAAPGEGSPPHDSYVDQIVERAALTRRCRATLSQWERAVALTSFDIP